MTNVPPDWYPDPSNPYNVRWWDGVQWTGHVAPAPSAVAAQPQVAAVQQEPTTVASMQQVRSRKTWVWWVGGGAGVLFLIVIIPALFSALNGLIGLIGAGATFADQFASEERWSDEQLVELQQELNTVVPDGYTVTEVYKDGSACENLCSYRYVWVTVPDNGMSSDVAQQLVDTTAGYITSQGFEDGEVFFGFTSTSGEWMKDDGVITPWEQTVYDAFRNIPGVKSWEHGEVPEVYVDPSGDIKVDVLG